MDERTMTDFEKYPVIKTVYKIVLAGCWTDTQRINKVKELNGIPKTANHAACYNAETNTTIIEISVTPQFG